MPEPLLALESVEFSYGTSQVLFGVDLVVHEAESFALLGTNGAGKSTILRVAAGLEQPSRGSVRFAGEDVTHLGAEERATRGLVLVPGGRATFGDLTVEENLRIGAWLLRSNGALVAERIAEAYERFPSLADRRHVHAAALSGGQQQMLAVAKGLLLHPRLLAIDELSLGLAPVVVEQLLDILASLRGPDLTVILVEQSLHVAAAACDRAVFLEKGRIRFEGAPSALIDRADLARAVLFGGAVS